METNLKTIVEILPSELIEALAQPTKEQPICTKVWAEWLKVQTFNDPEIETMVVKCAQWANRVKTGQNPSWLSLIGKSGVGKTHCAKRLWKWSHTRFPWGGTQYNPHVIYWPEFVADLRSGDSYDRFRDMREWPVLFLDDIGAERDTTGFSAEQLNMILGVRVGRWTILTSNLMLDQIGGIDPRIADRIVREPGNLYVELTTQSYALRNI